MSFRSRALSESDESDAAGSGLLRGRRPLRRDGRLLRRQRRRPGRRATGPRRPRVRLGRRRRHGVLRRVRLARLDDQRLALGALRRDVLGVEVVEEVGQPPRIRRRGRLREERRQIVAQLLAAGVAVLQIGRQRLQRDAIQLGRHARRRVATAGPDRDCARAAGSPRRCGRPWAPPAPCRRKQLPPREQLPQDDARRVQIGAAVELLAARLLGRHVADLAVDDPGRGLLQLQRRRRQPEVGQPHLAAVRQQHVRRRNVAVDQLDVAEAVRVVQAARELLDDVRGDVDGERDALLRAAVPGRAQVLAFDVVHREVDLARDLARIEHGHQVAVRQPHDDLGLVAETLQVFLVGEVRQHRLDDAQLRAVLRARTARDRARPCRRGPGA